MKEHTIYLNKHVNGLNGICNSTFWQIKETLKKLSTLHSLLNTLSLYINSKQKMIDKKILINYKKQVVIYARKKKSLKKL